MAPLGKQWLLLTVAATMGGHGSVAFTASLADPNCDGGLLESSGVGTPCCAASCGTCGGSGCSSRPGGADACCGSNIAASGVSCGDSPAPCLLDDSFHQCTMASGAAYDMSTAEEVHPSTSLGECCELCAQTAYSSGTPCAFFHADASNDTCVLHNDNAPDFQIPSDTATSGFVGYTPAPPTPTVTAVDVVIDGAAGVVSTTQPNLVCWNIDASRNREFFDRNLSQAGDLGRQLAYQAAALGTANKAGYSWLRFGGTGNDYLTYEFNGTVCPAQNDTKECLNETTWTNLLDFTEASAAKMIFGLSMNTGQDRRRKLGAVDENPNFPSAWDPSNAREILTWTIKQGRGGLIGGFELGNEQNSHYDAETIVANFGVLWDLVQELWPDEEGRPYLFGPDPHSCKQDGCSQDTLDWIAAFIDGTLSQGIPIHAATHHEYVEVDATTWLSPTKLDVGEAIATDINRTVATASAPYDQYVLRVGGEIGPSNAGSPVCDHTSMRFAVFGDSIWYADSLALKAYHGYDLYCRQDYVGADYGMVDCLTGTPLPDFYTALVWNSVMGTGVLDAQVPTDNATSVRAYAHCSPAEDGGITVLMLNLNAVAVNATVSFADASPVAKEGDAQVVYVLEGSDDASAGLDGGVGLASTAAVLNGEVLALADDGTLPSVEGLVVESGVGAVVELAPESVTFVTYPKAGVGACGSNWTEGGKGR